MTPELTVEAGTTVIWINDSRSVMEIQFEGKQVTMACKSPVHFVIDEKGDFSYVARKAATGGAISQMRDSIKNFKGKVTVK